MWGSGKSIGVEYGISVHRFSWALSEGGALSWTSFWSLIVLGTCHLT
jgi:hypothetical protein